MNTTHQIPDEWRIPDELWTRLSPLLPKWHPSPKGGRPALPLRQVADGIFYVLRTGCQWKAAPREFGSGSALHNYFQRWVARGVFRKLWKKGLLDYDKLKGIQWEWQCIDGTMTKAPLGGEKNREKSYRPRKNGNQAFAPHGRWRGALGLDREWSQHPRHAARASDCSQHTDQTPYTNPSSQTELLRRQGV